jgi:hypothetical protein
MWAQKSGFTKKPDFSLHLLDTPTPRITIWNSPVLSNPVARDVTLVDDRHDRRSSAAQARLLPVQEPT